MRRIAIVTGEASGDYLGAGLIAALRRQWGELDLEGIGGPRLLAEGCRSLASMERLSVMGLFEVAGRLPGLYLLRRRLLDRFGRQRPDLFIGVDAPDFNLGLARGLRRRGIPTVQYVGPSVWAWRRYRLQQVRRAVDLVLVLFPFEESFYRDAAIPAVCVGHPLADQIPLEPDRQAARQRLGLPAGDRVVALMPGSRDAELGRHLVPFLHCASILARRHPDLRFACSLLDQKAAYRFRAVLRTLALDALPVDIHLERSHDVLEAADAAVLASGTVTLEAMLFKCPMVVAYRMNPLTFAILRRLVKVPFVALPNLLANSRVVPEYLQEDCTPQALADGVERWLVDGAAVTGLREQFLAMHRDLRRGGSVAAAGAVMALVEKH